MIGRQLCKGLQGSVQEVVVWFWVFVLVLLSKLLIYLIKLLIMTTESNKSDSGGECGSETEQHHSITNTTEMARSVAKK